MPPFRPDRQLASELRKQPAHKADLRRHAERAKKKAEAFSPRGTSHVGYAKRFRITDTGTAVRLGNSDIAAHLIEWGSANNPPYAPLRRAVKAAGLRLEEDNR